MNIETVSSAFAYDPSTGVFTRNGIVTGSKLPNGYIYLSLKKKRMLAHRVAWLLMTGSEPVEEIDHINGVKTDNRWENLRPANRSQNAMNQRVRSSSKSGFKGVSWHSRVGKWRACIKAGGKHVHIGYFDNREEAAIAYNKTASNEFKQFHYENINSN